MKRTIILLFTLMALLSFQNNINNTIDFKKIEQSMIKINQNIYASKYEVTNFEFNNFLKYLQDIKQKELYAFCLYDSTKWRVKWTFNKTDNSLNPLEKMYHWHPNYSNYPIVNITYEAATKYCEWLTEQYNNYSKRKFKKVLFKLPSELEWLTAANAWYDSYFPWYGTLPYSYENKKWQCYANIKMRGNRGSVKEYNNYAVDGAIFTSMVGYSLYPPNRFGLYDIIGNVSEMLIEKGKQKGGNWDSYIEECGVNKTQELEVPDPRVGFRVFMEVIEESKK